MVQTREVPDVAGFYDATLIVNDGTVPSAPDTVVVTADTSPPGLSSISPFSGQQGTSFQVSFNGANLATVTGVISANPSISGNVVSVSDTLVEADITVDLLAVTGATTLGLTSPEGSASLVFIVLQAPVSVGIPFSIPGAIALTTSETGNLPVTLAQPAVADATVTLVSDDLTVATQPASVIIPAGAGSVAIPITAVGAGTTAITVTISGFNLSTAVFVTAPFSGPLELLSASVGTFVTPIEGITLAPVVGAQVVSSLLPTVLLSSGTTRIVTVELADPAPVGGLCVRDPRRHQRVP